MTLQRFEELVEEVGYGPLCATITQLDIDNAELWIKNRLLNKQCNCYSTEDIEYATVYRLYIKFQDVNFEQREIDNMTLDYLRCQLNWSY